MKSFNKQLAFCAFLLFSGLAFLPGCGLFNKQKTTSDFSSNKASGSDVLMSIDGVPALTVQEYEEQLDMARKANPQIEMFLQMMPNAEREFVFRGMATARLMKAWAHKQGIDQTEEFKKQQKHLHEAMDLQLYMKYFDEAHPVNITDAEVAKFYEEKKDTIPGLALAAGGVETAYVRFESKDKAQGFMDKVKDVKKFDTFKKIAEEHKHQVGQSTINDKSPFGDAVKQAVLDVKKFPSVQVIKVGDNAYWVILATGKVDAKYHDLKSPQVQQGLRKMIADERKEKQLEAMIGDLKKDLNVEENSKYFDDKEAKKRADMESQMGSDDLAHDAQQESTSTLKV